MAWGTVELEPEVRDWLEQLPIAQFAHAAFYVDLLAEQGRCWGNRIPSSWMASSGSFGSTWAGMRYG
jgi:hypothetical protein